MPEIIHVPASMLSVSPLNVRKQQDEEANLRLRAHIVARGLLQNLIGIPVPRKKGRYEITAGGRRLTQIHAAIQAKQLDPGYLVPLLVMDDRDDGEEDSLAENYHRLSMNPADECIAFQAIIQREKRKPSDIAKRWGLTERYVLGRLRLAGLADIVFEALREGDITLDMASAYAATSDRAAQETIYRESARLGYGVHPDTIRRRVQQPGYTAASWKVRLIARDDYVGEGGRIDGDLFADAATEVWLDSSIVDTLAQARLEAIARDTQQSSGFATVRIIEDEREIWSETQQLEALVGGILDLTDEDRARRREVEAQIEAYQARSDDPDGKLTDEEHSIVEGLHDELASIDNPTPILSDEQKARAIAFIFPAADGKIYLHHEIYAEPLPAEPVVPVEDCDVEVVASPDRPVNPVSVPRETESTSSRVAKPGISQRLAAELAIQKTELIAVHVANDPHFALDLAMFVMADQAERPVMSDLPTELSAGSPASTLPDFRSTTQAAGAWKELEDGLDRSWSESEEPTERFDAFRALDPDAKAAWIGWSVARTLRPVDHGRSGSEFLDHIGTSLGIDAAAWWRPTAANYFDRISKPMILEAFAEFGGVELQGRYAAAKKIDLATAAEKLFRGEMMVEAETKAAAYVWLPRSMALSASAHPERAEMVGDTPDEPLADAA